MRSAESAGLQPAEHQLEPPGLQRPLGGNQKNTEKRHASGWVGWGTRGNGQVYHGLFLIKAPAKKPVGWGSGKWEFTLARISLVGGLDAWDWLKQPAQPDPFNLGGG